MSGSDDLSIFNIIKIGDPILVSTERGTVFSPISALGVYLIFEILWRPFIVEGCLIEGCLIEGRLIEGRV